MKYLIVVSSLSQGSGLSRYVFSLCNILKDEGNIYVLTTHNVNTQFANEELEKIPGNITLMDISEKKTAAKYFAALKLIRSIRPDIIIDNYNATVQYLAPLFPGKSRLIHVLHNDTEDFYRVGAINGRTTDGWIAPTQAIADNFNAYTSSKFSARIKVIPHGVKEVPEKFVKPSDTLNIVFTGVLYEHKGVKILPEIVRQLRQYIDNFKLTIIGKGVLGGWLKDELEDACKSGIVEFTGVIPHQEVYRKMSESHIFLYPTHIDAFGLVIAEAMMNGAVPVVTLLSGITDNLVDNGLNGFLLPQDNVDAFVKTIRDLASDRERLDKLSHKTHRKASDCLSMAVMSKNYRAYLGTFNPDQKVKG